MGYKGLVVAVAIKLSNFPLFLIPFIISPITNYLITEYWLLTIDCWPMITDYRILITDYRILTTINITHLTSHIIHHTLYIIHYIFYLIPYTSISFMPLFFSDYRSPITDYRILTTSISLCFFIYFLQDICVFIKIHVGLFPNSKKNSKIRIFNFYKT